MSIRAIETEYNGYRFRSRTEARWAVFFDVVGIEYEYEKEGYELPSGRYLPDFWLPNVDAWFEVKGGRPTEAEILLGVDLWRATGKDVWLSTGAPSVNNDEFYIVGCGLLGFAEEFDEVVSSFSKRPVMDGYSFAADRKNENSIWLFHGGFGRRALRTRYSTGHSDKPPLDGNYGLLRQAYVAAKSARFEFGESGAIIENFTSVARPSEKIISDETITKMIARRADAHRNRARYELEWIPSPPIRTTS